MSVESSAPVTTANPQPPEDDDEHAPRLDLTPRKIAVFGLFVVLALVALYFLLPKLAGLEDTWHRIEKGDPYWLVLALVFTFGMFGGYVFLFHAIFDDASSRLNWRESYQITMAALAATRLLSAGGAGGLVLQAWALRRSGLRARVVADRTVTFVVVTYLVYTVTVAITGIGLYTGVLNGSDAFSVTLLPAVLAIAATAAGLSIAFVPPDLQRRLTGYGDDGSRSRRLIGRLAQLPASASTGIRDALHRVARRDASLWGATAFWGFQVAVLWASFRAFGESPPIGVVVMGFFIGMLGNLLPLPGGIGGIDGGMIGAFAALGVDVDLAIVAVLVYRGFTFWLPTIPGVIAYLQLRRTVDRWRTEGRTAGAAA
jgi:uncharacterized membrane protein YbhN (UPF0104 family)